MKPTRGLLFFCLWNRCHYMVQLGSIGPAFFPPYHSSDVEDSHTTNFVGGSVMFA